MKILMKSLEKKSQLIPSNHSIELSDTSASYFEKANIGLKARFLLRKEVEQLFNECDLGL